MPYGIRPVDRSCGSYGPGHQMHWIQAKKSAEEGPLIHVSVVVNNDGRVDLEGHELKLTMWNHDPDRLREAVNYCGRAVWKPRFHVLAVPGPSGYLFSMATSDNRTPCIEKVAPPAELQTTVDRVLWEARTYGGYTVPLSSLRPGDEVEIAKELHRNEMKFRHRGGIKQ